MQRRCRSVSFCCVLKRCCSDRVRELHGFWTADPGVGTWQKPGRKLEMIRLPWARSHIPRSNISHTSSHLWVDWVFFSFFHLFPVWWDILVLWRVNPIILKQPWDVRLHQEIAAPRRRECEVGFREEKSWTRMVNMVTSNIHIYIPTGAGFFSTYLDKSCQFSVEFIIWMSKVQYPLNQVVSCWFVFHILLV